jgi:superfamily II DNA helicase RecQ
VLVDLAKRRPTGGPGEVAATSGMPRHGTGRVAADFAAAIARGIAAGAPPPRTRAPAPRIDGGEIRARREREDKLRTWRKKHATARKLPPMAILPSYTVEDLVQRPPAVAEDLATRPGMIPKRMRLYGDEILALLAS